MAADHPRSRGVYQLDDFRAQISVGSSPLARGLHPFIRRWRFSSRIIPARAGFTGPWRNAPFGPTDHPRSRGVYAPRNIIAGQVGGSSPLARGLHPCASPRHLRTRIIPARAGFTRRCCQCWTWFRDHPRSRGVYEKSIPSVYARPGSSPLARGLLGVPYVWGGSSRIIPARAGFTSPFSFMAASAMDHPRSRGVYDRRRRVYVIS